MLLRVVIAFLVMPVQGGAKQACCRFEFTPCEEIFAVFLLEGGDKLLHINLRNLLLLLVLPVGRPRSIGLGDRLNEVKDVSVTLEVSNTCFCSALMDRLLLKEPFAEASLS